MITQKEHERAIQRAGEIVFDKTIESIAGMLERLPEDTPQTFKTVAAHMRNCTIEGKI